jgi:hypothetical protein
MLRNPSRILSFSALAFLLPPVAAAWADLQVYPTRLLLTDTQRSAHLSMRLTGNQPGRFRISTQFYRMKPDGALEKVDQPTPADRSAQKLLRFSPRVVDMAPGQEQVVRVMSFSSEPLEEGEYRAHLFFEPAESEAPENLPGADKKSLSLKLQARIAIAIPVTIRRGRNSTTATLSDLKWIARGKPSEPEAFEASLQKTGNGFLYGDIELYYKAKGQPKFVSLFTAAGVSSYIDQRKLRFSVEPPAGLRVESGGVLRLEYRAPADQGGQIQAQTDSALP